MAVAVSLLALSVFSEPKNLIAKEAPMDSERAAAYYEVLDRIMSPPFSYGVSQIVTNPDVLYSGEEGLVYADLIDFDKDGQDELYVLYAQKDTSDPSVYFSNHVQEIWTSQDGEPVKLFEDSYNGFSMWGDRSTALIEGKDQVYLTFYSELERVGYHKFFALENGAFTEKASINYMDNGSNEDGGFTYAYSATEDGAEREVTEDEYGELLNKYLSGGEENQLVNGGTGSPEFVISLDNNTDKITAFLAQLKQAAQPSLAAAEKLDPSQFEQEKLNRFLYKFEGLTGAGYAEGEDADQTFNTADYDSGAIQQWMSWNLLLRGMFDYDANFPKRTPGAKERQWGGFYYKPYNTKALNRFTKNTMGIRIADEKKRTKESSEISAADENSIPSFRKEGTDTYIVSPDAGYVGFTVPQVTSLYSLGGGYYYADLSWYTSDEDDLSSSFDLKDYFVPMEKWSEAQRKQVSAYTYSDTGTTSSFVPSATGYAVLKQVALGGKPEWQLVRYNGDNGWLSDEDIQNYLSGTISE